MRLDGVLTQATSGLDSIARQLAVVAQNVANANTPGYVRESVRNTGVAADGQGMGVRTGVATRSLDTVLQADLFATGGEIARHQTRQEALDAIDAASGTPGAGEDLASLVGKLRDAFSTLLSDPANAVQHRAVTAAAADLAHGLNTVGRAVSAARQKAQDTLQDDVAAANDALGNLGRLTDEIALARNRGQSSADLEDKQDAAIETVIELTGAQVLRQPDGGVLVVSGGTLLPTRGQPGPLALDAANLAPGTPPSAIPPLTVSGQPQLLGGGRIAAKLALRNSELPAIQANLDNLAQRLAGGFAAAGLELFTDASGTVPSAPGFAQIIQVNPAVQALPSMVRDGAAPTTAAGDTTLIGALLDGVLSFGAGTVADDATRLVSGAAALAAAAARQVTNDQAVQSSLSQKLATRTAVSVDSELAEMVKLQNSYGANARVIASVQAMWDQLLGSIK